MVVKIFWEENCNLCPQAKELGKKLEDMGTSVSYYNVKEDHGINRAIFYDVLSTPSVVVAKDDKHMAKWEKQVPEAEEVLSYVNELCATKEH